jgi:YVTN family beta-propeller protein
MVRRDVLDRAACLGMAFVCALGVQVRAQHVEATVYLPDSLGGLRWPKAMACDPARGVVYVGGDRNDFLLAFDARTGQKLAAIPAGRSVKDMCIAGRADKLYCTDDSTGRVTVIDLVTMRSIRALTTGYRPTTLAYHAPTEKMYCTVFWRQSPWDSTLLVYDTRSDTLVAALTAGTYPYFAVANELGSKTYCAEGGFVTVVDCLGDSVLRRLNTGAAARALCFATATGRLYNSRSGSGNRFAIVDGATDSILGTTRPVVATSDAATYEPHHNKAYFALTSTDLVVAIDGATDSIAAEILVGYHPSALAAAPPVGKVYCANEYDGTVSVIDSRADTVLATVAVGDAPCALEYDSASNRVFVANREGHDVAVVDCGTDSVVGQVVLSAFARALGRYGGKVYAAGQFSGLVTVVSTQSNRVVANVQAGEHPAALCWLPSLNRVYCANERSSDVTVIDGDGDTVVTVVPVGSGPKALGVSPDQMKLYCANYGEWPLQDSTVTVIDAVTSQVRATLRTGNRPIALCDNRPAGKVYCANYGANTVTAIDALADSVVATIPVGRWPSALTCSPRFNRVYCANTWGATVSVIDGSADTVIATLPVGDQPVALGYDSVLDRVYCASRHGGSVTAIDCSTSTVLTIRWIGGAPAAVSCDPARGRVYCADAESNRVYVLAGDSLEVIAVLPTGREPLAMAWDPGTSRTYVANYSGSNLTVLKDTSAGVKEGTSYEGRVASGATVVRGVLNLSSTFDCRFPIALRDVSGRNVLLLRPGPNDLRHLAAGVYFVCPSGADRRGASSVVIVE